MNFLHFLLARRRRRRPRQNPGKGKLVGIILGSLLAIAIIAVCIWVFLPKEELPLESVKPAISVADYIKGKRFTYSLPEEAIDGLIPANLVAVLGPQINSIKAQLASQPVFMQFGTNNVVEYGTSIKGSVSKITQGTYSVDGLSVVLAKDGGNDTAVFTKAEPGIGDEFNMKFVTGKDVKIIIKNVEPAEPLQGMNMAMLGNLGLGGVMPAGGLANLFPATGSTEGAGKGKGKGGGYSQSSSSTGKRAEWTFGGGGKDLVRWKGQPAQNVLGVFGNPDQGKPWGQGGGAWTYKKMKITDAQGSPHKSVTFFIQNGQVVDIKLPAATAQP